MLQDVSLDSINSQSVVPVGFFCNEGPPSGELDSMQ